MRDKLKARHKSWKGKDKDKRQETQVKDMAKRESEEKKECRKVLTQQNGQNSPDRVFNLKKKLKKKYIQFGKAFLLSILSPFSLSIFLSLKPIDVYGVAKLNFTFYF